MIEIVMTIIILALIGILMYEKWENRKERDRFMNALMSETPEQFRDLELTSKVKPIQPTIPPPDLVPEADMSDTEFNNMIKGVN